MKPLSRTPFAKVAAILAASLCAAGCERDQAQAGWWQRERERIELRHQLELKKYRFEQAGSHDLEELETLRAAAAQSSAAIKSLRLQQMTLSHQVESLQGQWAGFKEATIRSQRQRAMGRTFEELRLVSGRSFQAVSVMGIDDSGVTIRHADGSARLHFADLDAGQQTFFGLEADLAQAAREMEKTSVAEYERWVDTRMASLEEKSDASAEAIRRDELAVQQRRAALAEQQSVAFKARPLGQPASSFGNRSWSSPSYSGYRSNRPTYRYIYYNNAPDGYSPCRPVAPIKIDRVNPRHQHFSDIPNPTKP
jgi:hypothetical protein